MAMGQGITPSPTPFSRLFLCSLVFLQCLTAVVFARPPEQIDPSTSSKQTDVETNTAWVPSSDKDRWRAFPKVEEVSTIRWWEQKLDDKLWDPDAHLQPSKEVFHPAPASQQPEEALEESPEFCKIDYECRAGRICVDGTCKCIPASLCEGHHSPVCGTDGVEYPSHCELHRTACVNRVHIRVDRRGECYQQQLKRKEKSWLMEQERLLNEDMKLQLEKTKQEKAEELHEKPQGDKPATIPDSELIQYPNSLNSDPITHDVKKSDLNMVTKQESPSPSEQPTSLPATAAIACTWAEMNKFKDDLLMYYCHKFQEPNCPLEVKSERKYLSMLMYSYYDQDFDYYLTAQELDDKERDEHFSKNTIKKCHLHDFVKYADTIHTDGKLTVTEFTNAFEVTLPSPPSHTNIEVVPTLASAGNGLELKCGIDADTVIWKRHDAQLQDDKRSNKLMVFEDGALFFSKVDLHHIGNYTCFDADNTANAQIHRLRVQTLPVVTVTPVTQTHLSGSDIELKCHAEGMPKPTLTWKQGNEVMDSNDHATHYYGGGHVVIHNSQPENDSGIFTCSAHNQAGTVDKSVSVTVLADMDGTKPVTRKDAGTFVVFHTHGISAYDPLRCLLRREINKDFGNFKFIPDALDGPLTLCQSGGAPCEWGGAVRVGKEFIYASQPDQNRVVIVQGVGSWSPIQVIDTDARPGHLWYVRHLDQVWVLCGDKKDGNKTIVVIRDASQHIQHRAVHTRPVGNHFDMVQDVFIAPQNDLMHEFDFAYVSHSGQKVLFKMNLEDMSYTKAIDLTNYGCVPTTVAFVPIGGHVVIQCVSTTTDQHNLQLIMDYLTDSITSTTSLAGRPLTSPDSRHLVTVDELTGKVTVASISEEGIMETTYEVTVSASISDVSFTPATIHQSYDLVMTSGDDDDVIIMNLVTGKVEKIAGSRFSNPSSPWHPAIVHRHISSGDPLSNFLMAPSKSSLTVLDIKFQQVECEFLDAEISDVIIHVPSDQSS